MCLRRALVCVYVSLSLRTLRDPLVLALACLLAIDILLPFFARAIMTCL